MVKPMARKPVNRWVYAGSTGWLFISVFHLINRGNSEPYVEFALDWITIAALLIIWPVLTTGRLVDIGLDKRWVLAFALPWVGFIITGLRGPRLSALVALCFLLAAQSFLVLWNGKPATASSVPRSDPTL
jgi:uncharacterized membrane protein YhaH (DUF805 family)